jgi:Leucine-rich repeat (LRR) protein
MASITAKKSARIQLSPEVKALLEKHGYTKHGVSTWKCDSIEIGTVIEYADQLPVKLDLSSSSISDLTVFGLAPNLIQLIVRKCKNIVDASALGNSQTLKVIILEGCENLISVAGLENIPTLDHLNLTNCSQLASVCNLGLCPSLKTICIEGCKSLTTLRGLGESSTLETIYMSESNEHLIEDGSLNSCKTLKAIEME